MGLGETGEPKLAALGRSGTQTPAGRPAGKPPAEVSGEVLPREKEGNSGAPAGQERLGGTALLHRSLTFMAATAASRSALAANSTP